MPISRIRRRYLPRANTYKVIVIGPSQVGKTHTVLQALLGADAVPQQPPTIGVEVHPLRYTIGTRNVCLNVWDCAGLGSGYYRHADLAVVVAPTEAIAREWRQKAREEIPGIRCVFFCSTQEPQAWGNRWDRQAFRRVASLLDR